MPRIGQLIDGKRTTDKSSRTGPVYNPATGEQIADVELASKDVVTSAIDAAEAAFGEWSSRTPINRARIMFRYKELLSANIDELAELVVAGTWQDD